MSLLRITDYWTLLSKIESPEQMRKSMTRVVMLIMHGGQGNIDDALDDLYIVAQELPLGVDVLNSLKSENK